MTGRIRATSPGVGVRLRAIRDLRRQGLPIEAGPGRACTGDVLGERLGIAALHAGRGEHDAARAAALLASAGLPDTPEHRAAVTAAFDCIGAAVRAAIGGLH
jgi:hypothetical protein